MHGMSPIVKKVAQLVTGFVFLYGIYIITHGHLTPGGGFAGGAFLSGAFILLVLSFGSDVLNLRKEEEGASVVEGLAILTFTLLAVMGFFVGMHAFFANYLPKGKIGELISAGLIPLYNVAVGVEVGAALLTIFLALVIYKEDLTK